MISLLTLVISIVFVASAQAACLRYNSETLAITGFNAGECTLQGAPNFPNAVIVDGLPATFLRDIPQPPGCDIAPISLRHYMEITNTSPLTIAYKPDIACFRGEFVTQKSEVYEIFEEIKRRFIIRTGVDPDVIAIVRDRCPPAIVNATCDGLRARANAMRDSLTIGQLQQLLNLLEERETALTGLP